MALEKVSTSFKDKDLQIQKLESTLKGMKMNQSKEMENLTKQLFDKENTVRYLEKELISVKQKLMVESQNSSYDARGSQDNLK